MPELGHRQKIALAAVAYGAAMLARPGDWRTDLFRVPFSLAPRWFWGASFLAFGLAKLIWRAPWTAYLLGSVLGAWVACIVWSIVSGYAHHGHPVTSPAGFVWPGTCLWLLLSSSGGRTEAHGCG